MCLRTNNKNSKIYEKVKLMTKLAMSGDKNPNHDGSLSKKAWASASDDRRKNQADVMRKISTQKRKPKEERQYRCVVCDQLFMRLEFCHHSIKEHPVCGHSCNGKRTGLKAKGRKNQKLSEYRKGKEPWNKGQKCPQTSGSKNGMNKPESKKKMSAIAKSRRKFTREDGSWTWIHPGDPNYPTTSVTEQVGTISES